MKINFDDISDFYEIIVVGAGPAGTAFVKTLIDRGANSILVIEKAKHPRDKVCGDGLCYAAVPIISDIFPELKPHIPTTSGTSKYTAWFSPSRRMIHQEESKMDVIPRMALDQMLFQTIDRSGVDILEQTEVVDLLYNEKTVSGLEISHNGVIKKICTKFVVGADGAKSLVARKVGAFARRPVIGIRQYIRGINPTDEGLVFFFDKSIAGYFWIFPFKSKGEWWANIGYGDKRSKDLAKRFNQRLNLPEVQNYIQGGELFDKPQGFQLRMLNVNLFGQPKLEKNIWGKGYALIGDSASLTHPHTGEGISGAVFSGHLAAQIYSQKLSLTDSKLEYSKGLLKFIENHYQLRESLILFEIPFLLPRVLRELYIETLYFFHKKNCKNSSFS